MKPITNQAYKLLHDGCVALSQVEANGIRIDVDYLKKAIDNTGVRITELSNSLKKYKIYKIWRKTYGGLDSYLEYWLAMKQIRLIGEEVD